MADPSPPTAITATTVPPGIFAPPGRAGWDALHAAAAFWPLPGRTLVAVAAADAARFLHNLCTNDINRLADGSSVEAFFPDAKGKTLAHATVTRDGGTYWVDAEPGRNAFFMRHLDRYVIREKVTLADHTDRTAVFHLSGPAAGQRIGSAPTGVVTRARRRSSQPGFDVLVPAERRDEVAGWLASAATELDPSGVLSARVLAGLPAFDTDFSESNLPQELDRNEHAISFTKGCYIGQETVARLDSYGHVNKVLRGLRWAADPDRPLPPTGTLVLHGGKEVGKLGSVAWGGPDGAAAVALAIVRTAAAEPGTAVVVQDGYEGIAATVGALPFA